MISKVSLRRLYLMAVIGVCLWGGLGLRLGILQIHDRAVYEKRAQDQQQRIVTLSPNRGRIFDRNLRTLALNVNVDSFGVRASDETHVTDAELRRFSSRFAKLTSQDQDPLFLKLQQPSTFNWIARRVDLDTSARIQSLPMMQSLGDRIHIEREVRRVYPYGQVAGQILGFAGVDGKGLAGIELDYHQLLEGTEGFSVVNIDAHGRQYSRVDAGYRPSTDGADLILTIDAACQAVAEATLKETVARHKAQGGMIILMQPSTGDILAMASDPSYDPNNPGDFPMVAQKMQPVVDMYEPGSTFKLVTATAALDSKLFSVTDKILVQNGTITIGQQTITDHEKFEELTMQEVIEHSSNVGTIKIAQTLGERRLYEYARAFGFGSTTGIGLPGEATGVLRNPMDWSVTSLSTLAIGYGVSVTALQLVTAYGAVATDGILMEPQIIKAIVKPDGSIMRRSPTAVRRVMSSKTAHTLKMIFSGVVAHGTGTKAAMQGYSVAGKTGTAWKAREDGPGYTRDYRSSFVGMFPAENPEVVALIVIDEPTENGFYGGDVAAPAFRRMMERLVHLPKGPVNTPPQQDARTYLAMLQEAVDTNDASDTFTFDTSIPVQVRIRPGNQVIPIADLEIRGQTDHTTDILVDASSRLPSVIGLSLREAIQRLAKEGINVTVVGNGLVIRQIPAPGSPAATGDRCLIECRPYDTFAFVSGTQTD